MRLEKLELQGFKSFADKTVFEFPKNLTAIVGPNGSGKSNISDAVRWVLGEQSMKTLRGKYANDVIFKGSDRLSKLGMASVALYLDNQDHKLPVDYREVVISRKIFTDGESEYLLNNNKVRLTDILMMLAQAKFGQKSYAVIGQGMITHFLSSSPQERKEFFDEATGVKEFQIKRDQAINKLIRTEDNLGKAKVLLTEIEPHLQSLSRQVRRLEKRDKIESELKLLQEEYYGFLWASLQTEHQQLKSQLVTKEGVAQDLETALQKQQALSDVISQEASRGERYQSLQKQFNELLERKSQVLKEQAVLKGKLEVEHERQGELSLVWLQRKEDEIMNDLRSHEDEMLVLEKQLSQDKNSLGRLEKITQSLQAEFRQEEYNILKLKEQIEQQANVMTVPEIKKEVRDIFEEQEAFLRELLQTKSLDRFKEVQAKAKKITVRFAMFMDHLNSEEKETIEAFRIEMKHKEQALQKLVAERENNQQAVNELRVSVETTHHKINLLHTQINRNQDELAQIQSNLDTANQQDEKETKKAQVLQYNSALQELHAQIAHFDLQLQGTAKEIEQFNQEEEDKKNRLLSIQSEMRSLQRKLTSMRQEANTLEVNMARVETRSEDLRAEIERAVSPDLHSKIYQFKPTQPITDHGVLEKKIFSLQRQLEAIGSVDEQTIQEHQETKERFDFLKTQSEDLTNSIVSLEKIIDELDATIHRQFQKNFKIINDGFEKYFKILFNGGRAQLEMLTDTEADHDLPSDSPQDLSGESLHNEKERELIGKKKKKQKVISGIEVQAQPPTKKVTNVAALSGGEKSMVSIALLCAIIAHNPSPFVFLDEIEAALDEENSEKLSAIIKILATKTQIIIITHNRITMRAADILYGVTMGREGKSHILSVELKEAEEMVTD